MFASVMLTLSDVEEFVLGTGEQPLPAAIPARQMPIKITLLLVISLLYLLKDERG